MMSLIGRGAASLLALVAILALYLILRGVQNLREIALQTEEHRLLLQLPLASSDVTGSIKCNLDLWRQYEDARWLQRTQHLLAFSLPMQVLLYGSFSSPPPVSRHVVTKYASFLLSQLQDDLRKSIPVELERIVNLSDQRVAAREVARLVTIGFYAKLFDSWEQGERTYHQALGDPRSQEKLGQLFRLVERAKPRLRGEAQLAWVAGAP
jgi:hypothetical protein